tara:strand:- start:54 stop:1175 length:1122 start_codon:yes stop_codon:yes gene_type:complete
MSIFSTDTDPKYGQMLITDLMDDYQSGKLWIPSYQRDFVWNKTDQEAFLHSIVSKNVLPALVINKNTITKKNAVIDGQNRLKTIYYYYHGIDDDIKIRTSSGDSFLYSELSDDDKNLFDQVEIPIICKINASDAKCQEIFTSLQCGRKLSFGEKIHALQTHNVVKSIESVNDSVIIYELNNYTIHDFIEKIFGNQLIKRYKYFELIGFMLLMVHPNYNNSLHTGVLDMGKNMFKIIEDNELVDIDSSVSIVVSLLQLFATFYEKTASLKKLNKSMFAAFLYKYFVDNSEMYEAGVYINYSFDLDEPLLLELASKHKKFMDDYVKKKPEDRDLTLSEANMLVFKGYFNGQKPFKKFDDEIKVFFDGYFNVVEEV